MRRTLLMAAVAVTALSVAACGGATDNSSGTTSTTAGPTVTTTAAAEEAASWMDKVCGKLLDLEQSRPAPPTDLATGGQQQALARFDTYVSQNIDIVNKAMNDLVQLGEPPVRGGSQIVNALVRGLAALRDSMRVAKDKFASIDTSNPRQGQAAVQDALESLDQGGKEFAEAVDSIQTNKDLEQAIDAAPNCQKLGNDTSTTSGKTTTTTT